MIRQDYLVRLIEQCAEALGRMLLQRQAGRLEPALQTLREAELQLLGSLQPVVERLEAASAVSVAGADLMRLYAGLIGEEGLLHQTCGDTAQAYLACRRAAELYAAVSLARCRLDDADLGRVGLLATVVALDDLGSPYAAELGRLRRQASSPP